MCASGIGNVRQGNDDAGSTDNNLNNNVPSTFEIQQQMESLHKLYAISERKEQANGVLPTALPKVNTNGASSSVFTPARTDNISNTTTPAAQDLAGGSGGANGGGGPGFWGT